MCMTDSSDRIKAHDGLDRADPYVSRVAIVVVLGTIMSILDTTIVNVALRYAARAPAHLASTSNG